MAVAEVELTIEGRESEAVRSRRLSDRYRSLVIFGRPTETNCGLAAAFAQLGQNAQLAESAAPPDLQRGDLAIARLDVRRDRAGTLGPATARASGGAGPERPARALRRP